MSAASPPDEKPGGKRMFSGDELPTKQKKVKKDEQLFHVLQELSSLIGRLGKEGEAQYKIFFAEACKELGLNSAQCGLSFDP